MKIAVFHELGIGGARKAVNEFSKELKKKHTIDLYIVDEDIDKNEKKYFNDLYFYKFIPRYWIGGNWYSKIYKDTIELVKIYKLHYKIAKIINAGNYDLIIVNPSKYTQSPFILRFIKLKKIYYCQETLRIVYEKKLKILKNIGLLNYYYELLNRFIRKKIDRSNVSYSDLILANSRHTARNIIKNYKLDSKVSYLGVDSIYYKPTKVNKKIDLLFIGSRDYMDGYNLLERSIKYMRFEPKIASTINKNRKKVNDNEIRSLYLDSRIVVCLAHDEPFGMIPLEAMASGALVIAVNEGGYKESIINKKTGFLINRDAKMLAQKVDWVLDNPKELSKITKNARNKIIENWTWEKRTMELEKYIFKLIDND